MIANRKKWCSVASVTREKECGFLTVEVASIPACSLIKLMTCKNGATSAEEIHTPFLNVTLHKRAPFLSSKGYISNFKSNSVVLYIHMLIGCSQNISPSKIVQYLERRSSRLIQDEFPELKKRYWGQHLWAIGCFCATVGSVTEEIIKRYMKSQELSYRKDIFKIEQ